MYKKVYLTLENGKVTDYAVVDKADFELINAGTWKLAEYNWVNTGDDYVVMFGDAPATGDALQYVNSRNNGEYWFVLNCVKYTNTANAIADYFIGYGKITDTTTEGEITVTTEVASGSKDTVILKTDVEFDEDDEIIYVRDNNKLVAYAVYPDKADTTDPDPGKDDSEI